MASRLSLLFVVLSVQQASCRRVESIEKHSFAEQNKTSNHNFYLEPAAPRWQGYEYVGYPPPQGTNPAGQPGTSRPPYPRGRQMQTPAVAGPNGIVAIDLTAKKTRSFMMGQRAGFIGQFTFADDYPAGRFQTFLEQLQVPRTETVAMLNKLSQVTSINQFMGGKMEEQNQACKKVAHEYKTKWHSEGKLQGYEVICYTWRFQYEEMSPCLRDMGNVAFGGMESADHTCLEQYDWDHHIVVRPVSMSGHFLEASPGYDRWCCCKPGTSQCKMKYEKTKTKCATGTFSTTHKELQTDITKCTIPDVEPLPKWKSLSGVDKNCGDIGGCFVIPKEM